MTLAVGDFVRGPGQPINLPGDTTDGIPISITVPEGVAVKGITYSGRGADTRPNRLLNPIRQAHKVDPAGDYVRRHVPEIAGLPDKFVHCPWEAPADVLDEQAKARTAAAVLDETAVDGTTPPPAANLPLDISKLKPGDVIEGRYKYIEKIGKGAFGTVLLMQDEVVDERLILKFLNPNVSSDEEMMKRFVHELRYSRKITHRNVIRIYDFLNLQGSYAISMEYFPSHTLSGEIPDNKPMAIEKVLQFSRDIATGMGVAHQPNSYSAIAARHIISAIVGNVDIQGGEELLGDRVERQPVHRPHEPVALVRGDDVLHGLVLLAQGHHDLVRLVLLDPGVGGAVHHQQRHGQGTHAGQALQEVIDQVLALDQEEPAVVREMTPQEEDEYLLSTLDRETRQEIRIRRRLCNNGRPVRDFPWLVDEYLAGHTLDVFQGHGLDLLDGLEHVAPVTRVGLVPGQLAGHAAVAPQAADEVGPGPLLHGFEFLGRDSVGDDVVDLGARKSRGPSAQCRRDFH